MSGKTIAKLFVDLFLCYMLLFDWNFNMGLHVIMLVKFLFRSISVMPKKESYSNTVWCSMKLSIPYDWFYVTCHDNRHLTGSHKFT